MIDTELNYLKQFLLDQRVQRLEEVLQQRTRHLTVVLENVHHDHNASACMRTVDCLGLQDVHVIDSDNEFRPNHDVALGASKWLTIHRYHAETSSTAAAGQTQQAECFRSLREKGYRILATSPSQNSVPLLQVEIEQPTAIVFGAEHTGVSQQSINAADGLVHIPMYGFTESFNISVSLAIILQQFILQLRSSDTAWRLSSEEQQTLLLHWIRKSLGQNYAPLKRRFDQQHGEGQ